MNNKRVLVVEDDADVRLGYRIFLQAHAYDTVVTADGEAAMSEAARRRPDLVILDLGLPLVDGFAVLQWFHDSLDLRTIPVIVVSGRDIQTTKDRALQAGARGYLQKPWDETALLAMMNQLLTVPPARVS